MESSWPSGACCWVNAEAELVEVMAAWLARWCTNTGRHASRRSKIITHTELCLLEIATLWSVLEKLDSTFSPCFFWTYVSAESGSSRFFFSWCRNNWISRLRGFTEKQGECLLTVVYKPSYPCVYLRTLNQFICDPANSHVLDKLSFQNIWI